MEQSPSATNVELLANLESSNSPVSDISLAPIALPEISKPLPDENSALRAHIEPISAPAATSTSPHAPDQSSEASINHLDFEEGELRYRNPDWLKIAEEQKQKASAPLVPTVDAFAAASPLVHLPDELLFRIFDYLSEPELGRTAQVCRRWREFSYDIPLWKHKSKSWHLLSPEQKEPPAGFTKSKAFFIRAFQHYKQRQVEEAERQRQQARSERRARRERQAATRALVYEDCLTLTFYNRVIDYLSYIGPLLGTIFICLKLDHRIDWHWGAVLAPFAMPFVQMFFALVCFDLARLLSWGRLSPQLLGHQLLPAGLREFSFSKAFSEGQAFRVILYGLVLSITLWWVLLWLKIGWVSAIPWWAVWGVLVFGTLLISITLLFGDIFSSDPNRMQPIWRESAHIVDRLLLLLPGVIALASLVFFALRLASNVQWSWWTIMLPVWIGFFCCACLPLCNWLMWCWTPCREQSGLSRQPGGTCICFLVMWVTLFGPLLTFFILIFQNVEDSKHRRWALVFIPMFLIEGLVCCACVFLDIALCLD